MYLFKRSWNFFKQKYFFSTQNIFFLSEYGTFQLKMKLSRRRYFCQGKEMENNTWGCVDVEFLFECSTLYLTSDCSERVRHKVEHKKRNSIATSSHVSFCLLYKRTNDIFLTVFLRFLKLLEGQRYSSKYLQTICEDHHKFSRKIRWCFDHTATHLSTFFVIFTREDMFCAKAHLVFHWCLYNKSF